MYEPSTQRIVALMLMGIGFFLLVVNVANVRADDESEARHCWFEPVKREVCTVENDGSTECVVRTFNLVRCEAINEDKQRVTHVYSM